MQEVIIDFFERFRSDITESIYAVKGIEDYQKLKTFYDYLDYDRQTIYRDNKDTEACGLRNIGNTCYLNVFLQILYHINFLREKIFSNQNQKSRILEELKYLFGRMQLGKLTYADPANLYEQLKKKHPDVFIDGVQNDFHEIFTILLDQLKESLKETSENDAKMIDKMLFGKLAVRTYHSEGKSLRNTRFNIINLDSSLGGLQKALQNWKRYEIEDYMTQNKKTVKASVQTEFIETPALMTFFINRVSFKDNSLVKDNREFLFQKVMHLSKGTSTPVQCVFSDKPSQKPSLSLKQQQLLLQKSALQSWITKSQSQKITLINTLKYLQQKQFPNINLPQIENKFEQQTTCSKVKEYLQEEIHQIQSKIQDSKKEIIAIDDKLIRIAEQGETQMYHLWGMMIHQGNTATSGHYKVVLNTDQDKWVEFNDRKVYPIDQAKIDTYSKKGQICCLFYRRPTLVCTQKKVALSGALKSKVLQIEKQIMLEVDNARVLQNLYQMSQSSGYLLEHQTKQKNQNRWFYFFKPILHCLQEHYTFSQCQGVLTYENLKQQSNIQKLQNSFLIERQMSVPDLSLQMPSEYFKYSQVFKKFTKKQTSFELVQEAFEWLADNLAIPIKNKTVAKWVQKYLEIFVMKGVFYLCVFFRATVTPLVEAKFTRLFKSIQKIMKKLNVTSDFTLTYIPIKDEVYRMFNTKIKNSLLDGKQLTKILKPTSNQALSKMICQNYCQLFKQRFGYWILEREKLSQIDEGIINSEAELQKQYIVELG